MTWTAIGLLTFAFTAAGAAKFAGVEAMLETYDKIGLGQNFRLVTASLEWIGVALLLMTRTRFFGALWLGGIMVGAVYTHVFVIGGSAVPAVVLGLLSAYVAYAYRPAFLRASQAVVRA